MKNYQTGAERQTTTLLSGSKFSKKITMFGLMAVMAAASVLTSCKKDSADDLSPSLKLNSTQALAPTAGGPALNLTDATGTVELSSTGVYTVKNYFVDQGIYSGTEDHRPNGNYYFDFSLNDNKKGLTSTTAPSGNVYDVSFSGTGNADIRINSALSQTSQIKFLNQSFSTVISTYTTIGSAATAWTAGTAPTAVPFGFNRTVAGTTATDYLAASASPIVGWYNYYFGNHQLLGTTDLTILIKDAAGSVYAVHMIDTYANATPVGSPPTNYSWLKFEYKKLL